MVVTDLNPDGNQQTLKEQAPTEAVDEMSSASCSGAGKYSLQCIVQRADQTHAARCNRPVPSRNLNKRGLSPGDKCGREYVSLNIHLDWEQLKYLCIDP